MDPKKKVSDILKENKVEKDLTILDFIRYKVGEGINEFREFSEKNYSSKMEKSIQSLKRFINLKNRKGQRKHVRYGKG